MDAAIDRAADRQGDRAELDGQGDRSRLELAPPVADAVLRLVLVHLEPVDISHVGRVDRIGPAEMFVMPEEGERAAGEIRPRIMPAFLALDDQFVPRHAATPGLVAVRHKDRRAARFLGRDCKCVGPGQRGLFAPGERPGAGQVGAGCGLRPDDFGRLDGRGCPAGITRDRGAVFGQQRLARHQRFDNPAQAEEERLAQRETRSHIDAVDGEEVAQLHFAGMRFGEIVEADGIGIEQRARVCGKQRIFALGRAARVEQVIRIVEGRALLARDRAIAPAAHRDHILQGGEIILRMRHGHAIGDIGIGGGVDMRYAEFIAADFGGVGPVGQGDIVALGPEGFPRRQRDECDQHEQKQRKTNAPQRFPHRFPSSLATRLARGAG